MKLDASTRAALGYGRPWEQLALRFPLFVVARRAKWREKAATRTDDRTARDAAYYQRKKARAVAAKLEARRAQYRESKRRARARSAA